MVQAVQRRRKANAQELGNEETIGKRIRPFVLD